MEKENSVNRNLSIASFAMQCVNEVVTNEEKKNFKVKYKTLVKKISTLIQKNGYISTIVFCYSKHTNEHNEVLNNIIEWNCSNDKINSNIDKNKYKSDEYFYNEYIEEVVKLDQKQYRMLTKEMMILFGWIKRFADGMIEDEY